MRAIWVPHSQIPRRSRWPRRRHHPDAVAHELLDMLDIVDGWRVWAAEPDPTTSCCCAPAGFGAGWIDAVVGGGGLVQLPALLLGLPSAAPAHLLATNKLASISGTATARTHLLAAGAARPADRAADGGGRLRGGGRRAPSSACTSPRRRSTRSPGHARRRGRLHRCAAVPGHETALRFDGHRHTVVAMITGFVIGVYDGALGPGTGCSSSSPWSG